MNREQLIAQYYIRRLTRPIDVIWESNGPDQFARPKELRGPIGWHRYNVWRDALGTQVYDEEAGLASIKDLTDEERETIRSQCAFIREHTKPFEPLWALPENPFLDSAWDFHTRPTERRSGRATYYDRNLNEIQFSQICDDLNACTIRTAARARPEWWGYATTKPTRPHLTSP